MLMLNRLYLSYFSYSFLNTSMSQKLISSFFASSAVAKRKREDIENCAKRINTEEYDDQQEFPNLKDKLIELSKTTPAITPHIGLSWFKALEDEFSKDYFKEIGEFLKREFQTHTIYPPKKDIYSWTNASNIHDVKVVILGQDPYHGPNQAHGLAFSVHKGERIPPSLRNIYKELAKDIPDFKIPHHGYLHGWASQGVLLLNTTLTVRAGNADSHKGRWNMLTDAVIKWINCNLPNSVFMLWGKNAQDKSSLIDKDNHLVLNAAHPSPLSASRGYFGCGHFSKANEYLKKHDKKEINWNHLP